MKKSTNYKMNLPDLSDQYSVDHWNDNTKIVDTELKNHQDNLNNVNNPTYEVSDELANLNNKESIFTAFGKIAKAVLDYITHKDTRTNVHGSTSSPTPNRIVERNTDGRAEIEGASTLKGITNLKQVQNDIMNKAFIGVKVAMKEDVTPFGEQTLGGVSLVVDDLVLLAGQINDYNNGVYVVHTGAWSRFENYKSADTINNSVIGVSEGTYKGKLFKTSVESYSENETPLIYFESEYSHYGDYGKFVRDKIGAFPLKFSGTYDDGESFDFIILGTNDSIFDGEYDLYDGSYSITPTHSQQTLNTTNTILVSDVVANAIPVSEVTDADGGTTITI